MSEKYEDVLAVDKMRSITEFVNRAGFVAMSETMRKKLWKLSVRQCAVLANIRRYTVLHPEGMSMSTLAERARMSPSSASHMVDSLMSQGMVERNASPTDRRAVLVTIAKSFLETSARIESTQMQQMEELCTALTEEERQVMERVLNKLYAAVIERDGL
jgi:DNA-binding MarR family transcriptional regulator